VTLRRIHHRTVADVRSGDDKAAANRRILEEDAFQKMIAFERKRSERSHKPCLLLLVGAGDCLPSEKNEILLSKIVLALSLLIRETDVTGWYKRNSVVGAIFTDIVADENNSVVPTMLARVSDTLHHLLTLDQFSKITIALHCYPEDWQHELSRRPSNPALYPDLETRDESRRVSIVIKRAMDIFGSLMAVILLAPVFLAIAIAIKLTSRGPVLFRQQRIGQHGRPFVFLKFRSMYVNSDTELHQEWFRSFYSGKAKRHATGNNGNGSGSFKPPNDPRVTRIGRLIRRTSMDELPQFFNVLKGEMSLVGPRPPIPYEVDAYRAWHRGRILQARPGITGLWQVSGRSRVTFDEMVRLDLRYARTWTIWLDIKILLHTPRAVFFGEGAY
jgi:exopolysaccharide biosynthesis polyprenyl glycosylphosphotransferase